MLEQIRDDRLDYAALAVKVLEQHGRQCMRTVARGFLENGRGCLELGCDLSGNLISAPRYAGVAESAGLLSGLLNSYIPERQLIVVTSCNGRSVPSVINWRRERIH